MDKDVRDKLKAIMNLPEADRLRLEAAIRAQRLILADRFLDEARIAKEMEPKKG